MTKHIRPGSHAPHRSSEAIGSYSSPACYLHEFDTVMTGMTSWDEIRDWRKQTRQALIANRLAWSVNERRARGEKAQQRLLDRCDLRRHAILGIYWPMRGEIDIRSLACKHIDAGGMVGLPVVVEKSAPVEFWQWSPGMKMRPGVWKIPLPVERVVLTPDALIVPLVGFDAGRYRLGYGGGYYDRTIASAAKRPFCIGLGYAESVLSTIYPQPHDMPMDLIVTDDQDAWGRFDSAHPSPLQNIPHPGACGQTRVVAQDRSPMPEPGERGVTKCVRPTMRC